MNISTARLGQAAGVAAAAAGAIYIAVQVNHPAMTVESATTTDWVVRNAAKTAMAALALAGITGIYLRQHARAGLVGLVGYLVLSAGFLMMFATTFMAAFALPTTARTDPAWTGDVIQAAFHGSAGGDIGALTTVFAVTGVAYVLGGLLFGVTTFRAGILSRWAAVLLAVGNVSTAALAVLPQSFNRPLAVPTGLALIGLGISLWRDQHTAAGAVTTPAPQGRPAASVR
ncbi:hypothetical protein [Intrasporangium sp. YIM S08009]|uniref:hypothetical protein n=1 Tax=Intrasporangium zincisolvens TaxID=3080018 RepID=UPI002B052655|nr:hypothetical protein [Intrasporangium sp. YIM S08009]